MLPRPVLLARRAFLALFAIAVATALIVWATGGFGISVAGLHVSSRNPLRPLILAAVCAAAWLMLRFLPGGRTSLGDEWTWWRERLPSPRRHPAVVIALGCALADISQWLRGAPLWLDEQMIAVNLRDRSFADLTGTLWFGQSAPLGWLWAQRAVLLALGSEELVLRVVPLIFGLATIAAAAWIGRRWLSPLAASLFVLLCWIGVSLSHYRFELKHYSADVFFALLLPALAVWTTEAESPASRLRRPVVWFVVAGAGQWFAYGALFVAPACVIWMLGVHIRSRDLAGGLRLAAAGVIWLVLFAGHYALSIRYTHSNTYLREYWADRVAPASGRLDETVTWFRAQLKPVARDAGGTRLPVLFWIVATGGLMLASSRRLGTVYVLVPMTAVVLALARLVPFYGRFSLWIVPALYLGLVSAVARAVEWLARGYRRRHVATLLAGAITGAAALVVTADLIDHGWGNIDVGVPAESNHGVDDRTGVPWLMRQRQAGDAILAVELVWPAIWWYGSLALPPSGDGRLPDGTTLYRLTYHQHPFRCTGLDALRQHRRVLFYVSFPAIPADAYPMVEREILALGSLAAHRQFTPDTRGFVVRVEGTAPTRTLTGCLDVQPARRW